MRSISIVLVRRLAWLLFSVWGVATIVFFLSRVVGDPITLLTPLDATQTQIEQTTRDFGLDRPLMVQYAHFISDAARGDFGDSYIYREPALHMVFSRLWPTAQLALLAVGGAVVVGIPLGLAAALNPGGWLDRLGSGLSLAGQSVPSFLLGPLLIMFFAVYLPWFPASGKSGPASYVLPVIALASLQVALLFRITRAAAGESLSQGYSRLVLAKGASGTRLAVRHTLPNIAGPVLTMTGLGLAQLLGGTVVVEQIFAWPGNGRLLIAAAGSSDFPLIQALVLTFSIGYVCINTMVEAVHEIVDPRVGAAS